MNNLDTIFSDDWADDHRSGFIAVIGRPNVGKSTLINSILGQKINIISPKPQTTRKQQLGIRTEEHLQMIFMDTPGMHKAQNRLGEYMMDAAYSALRDADVILWILDVSEPPQTPDYYIAETVQREVSSNTPIVLALNKADLLPDAENDLSQHLNLIEHHSAMQVSALEKLGIQSLVEHLATLLPYGPRFYPVDQASDVNMRFIAAEIIREKIILNTEQEIPYSVAVDVQSYHEGDDRTTINATIYVERDSQKGIIIGKGGVMIRTIGTAARHELMDMLNVPVHLDLHVKVLKNWRSNEALMKRIGYRFPKKDED